MTSTYVSRLTGSGRGAVAVIALAGPHAAELLGNRFRPVTSACMRPGQIRYGTWHTTTPTDSGAKIGSGEGESVVVTPIADDHFEIHGHGGAAAVSQIIASLTEQGATEVPASQFDRITATSTAEVHEPLIAEAQQVLIACTTQRNAAIALSQTRGPLLRWTIGWSTRIEESRQNNSTESMRQTLASVSFAARELLEHRSVTRHLVTPYRVVLAGPPNVGKSSLVNAVVGFGRSITHDAAGTTRDVVDVDTVIAGLAIRIGDTAGIRTGGSVIEQEGIRRGAIAVTAADLVILVVDPGTVAEASSLEQTVRSLNPQAAIMRVLNKADLLDDAGSTTGAVGSDWMQTVACGTDGVHDGDVPARGVVELCATMAVALRPRSCLPSEPMPVTLRQIRWLEAIAEATDLPAAADALEHLRLGTDFPSVPVTL